VRPWLSDDQLSTIAAALTSIVKHFAWQGNIGIGLPGRVAKAGAYTRPLLSST
jgi:hypothetical protein